VSPDPGPELHVGGAERAVPAAIEVAAKNSGARVVAGGSRIGNRGYLHQLTVPAATPDDARAMRNEREAAWPTGLALSGAAREAIDKANSLPVGLAAYAPTRSASHFFHLVM
jgi:succinate-semialdehyde dehydrogenase/glutarate-semialdehyde dehydrogenase